MNCTGIEYKERVAVGSVGRKEVGGGGGRRDLVTTGERGRSRRKWSMELRIEYNPHFGTGGAFLRSFASSSPWYKIHCDEIPI